MDGRRKNKCRIVMHCVAFWRLFQERGVVLEVHDTTGIGQW